MGTIVELLNSCHRDRPKFKKIVNVHQIILMTLNVKKSLQGQNNATIVALTVSEITQSKWG